MYVISLMKSSMNVLMLLFFHNVIWLKMLNIDWIINQKVYCYHLLKFLLYQNRKQTANMSNFVVEDVVEYRVIFHFRLIFHAEDNLFNVQKCFQSLYWMNVYQIQKKKLKQQWFINTFLDDSINDPNIVINNKMMINELSITFKSFLS